MARNPSGHSTGMTLSAPLATAALAAAYVLLGSIGFRAAPLHPVVSTVWAPAGLAFAALVLFGWRLWPAVWIGAIAVNLIGGIPVFAATLIGLGNALSAAAGAIAMRRTGIDTRLERLRDVGSLSVAAFVATTISATIGVASLVASGQAAAENFGRLWFIWWSGDTLGVLIVAPLLFTWLTTKPTLRWPAAAHAVGLALLTVTATYALFSTTSAFVYALFPLTALSAMRFGTRGAAASTVVVTALATLRTVQGAGPFAVATQEHNLFLLQLFLALLALKDLVLAASLAERRDALRATSDARQSLQEVFDASPIGMFQADAQGAVQRWSLGAERMFGWSESAVRGQPCPTIPSELRSDYAQMVRRAMDGTESRGLLRPQVRADGAKLWTSVHCAPVRNARGNIIGALVIVEDVTGRVRMEREISESRERLAGLTRKVFGARDAERSAIARGLHDELGQTLVAVKLGLEALRDMRPADDAMRTLDDQISQLDVALQSVRELSFDLHPSVLDDLGLAAALRTHVDRHARRAGLRSRVAVKIGSRRLAHETEVACFRIAQEALSNVIRHAQAHELQISVVRAARGVTLTVQDDGVGFDPASVRENRAGGIGLLGLTERASLAGGTLMIQSAPGRGTTITAEFPITGPDASPADSVEAVL